MIDIANINMIRAIHSPKKSRLLVANARRNLQGILTCTEAIISQDGISIIFGSDVKYFSDSEKRLHDNSSEDEPDYGSYINFYGKITEEDLFNGSSFSGRFGDCKLSIIENIEFVSNYSICISEDINGNSDLELNFNSAFDPNVVTKFRLKEHGLFQMI